MRPSREEFFQGTIVSRGLGIGKVFYLSQEKLPFHYTGSHFKDLETEKLRLKRAWHSTIHDIEILKTQLKREGLEEAVAIFDAHLQILHDPFFFDEMLVRLREERLPALEILKRFQDDIQLRFYNLEDPFFKERVYDLQDVIQRMAMHLKRKVKLPLRKLPPGSVVVADHLTPSELAMVGPNLLSGVITQQGSVLSHLAVIAKSKQIPMLTHIDLSLMDSKSGAQIIIDAMKGEAILHPSQETLRTYAGLLHEKRVEPQTVLGPCKTFDGEDVAVLLSIGSQEEVNHPLLSVSEGVGLLRTESFFFNARNYPSEEEQRVVLEKLLERLHDKPLVVRAFDWGSDKPPPYIEELVEPNPALGKRAIRLLLQNKDIFKTQIRAVLKALEKGDIRFLLPMVTDIEEVVAVRALIEEVRADLKKEGFLIEKELPLGCMIEVPAAALQADLLAEEVSFFSIGINDLVQYTLAVDRSNDLVSSHMNPTHIAVMRLISFVVQVAKKKGIPLSVCGEVGSSPKLLSALLGCGVRCFSVTPHDWHFIRNKFSYLSLKDIQDKMAENLQANLF